MLSVSTKKLTMAHGFFVTMGGFCNSSGDILSCKESLLRAGTEEKRALEKASTIVGGEIRSRGHRTCEDEDDGVTARTLPLPLSILAYLSTTTAIPLFKYKKQLSQHVFTTEAVSDSFDSYFIDEVQDIFEALGRTVDTIHDSVQGGRYAHCFIYKLRSNGNRNNVARVFCRGRRIGRLYYSTPTEAEFIPATVTEVFGTPRGRFVGDFHA
ncbi:hypothetical protein IW261DRAFT_1626260 [Armillaria novae-zelandiae]|uniref:Uncharacterized protein n=1 Tax=Armillaria novae-zelandiae TaxID=153914 RepID=A0AA39P7Z0_9AGAR|nr:hypothetical protein IW261DRAFT_1626260 [Armillaria novae-zelandiae]